MICWDGSCCCLDIIYLTQCSLIFWAGFWVSWIRGSVSNINLGEMLTHYCFKYFLLCLSLFLLLLVFPLHVCYTSRSCLTVLGYSYFFSSLCSLCFWGFKDSIDRSFSSEILSSVKSSRLIMPSKAFLNSVTAVICLFIF